MSAHELCVCVQGIFDVCGSQITKCQYVLSLIYIELPEGRYWYVSVFVLHLYAVGVTTEILDHRAYLRLT